MNKAQALWRPATQTQPSQACPYPECEGHVWDTEEAWAALQLRERDRIPTRLETLILGAIPRYSPISIQESIQIHEQAIRRTRCFVAGHPEWFTEWR